MKKQTSNDTELTRAIERIGLGRGMDFGSLFDDFLDFLLSFQCANPTDRQRQLFGEAKANTELWNAYADAIKAYETAAGDYHDPLGDTFMSRISHGSNGQFFTPDAVCSLLARITIDGTTGDIYDPACGSGRTLLAALKRARDNGCEPSVIGGDIAYKCARMTLANLLFNNAHGEVMQGDSLRLDIGNFTFYRMEKMVNPQHGIVASNYWRYTVSDVEKVDEVRKMWLLNMACHGWYPYNPKTRQTDSKPEPMPTRREAAEAAKRLAEANGKQLTLSFT